MLYVMDVATGKSCMAEAIDRTSDGNVIGWRPDNRSFFYLRYNEVVPGTRRPTESDVQRAHLPAHRRHEARRRTATPSYSAAACRAGWTCPKARAPTSWSRPIRRTRSRWPTTTWTTTRPRLRRAAGPGHRQPRHAVEEGRRRRRRRDGVPCCTARRCSCCRRRTPRASACWPCRSPRPDLAPRRS